MLCSDWALVRPPPPAELRDLLPSFSPTMQISSSRDLLPFRSLLCEGGRWLAEGVPEIPLVANGGVNGVESLRGPSCTRNAAAVGRCWEEGGRPPMADGTELLLESAKADGGLVDDNRGVVPPSWWLAISGPSSCLGGGGFTSIIWGEESDRMGERSRLSSPLRSFS